MRRIRIERRLIMFVVIGGAMLLALGLVSMM
jgi:hypothetical protein